MPDGLSVPDLASRQSLRAALVPPADPANLIERYRAVRDGKLDPAGDHPGLIQPGMLELAEEIEHDWVDLKAAALEFRHAEWNASAACAEFERPGSVMKFDQRSAALDWYSRAMDDFAQRRDALIEKILRCYCPVTNGGGQCAST